MGMPAARGARTRIPRVRSLVAYPMNVVGNRFDIVIDVRIEMRPRLPVIAPALDHVKQVRNNTRLDDALAVLIKIYAPRITGAFRENLKSLPRRMIPPYSRVDFGAFL